MKSTDELLDFRAPDRGVVPTFGLDIEQVEPELVSLDDAIDTAIRCVFMSGETGRYSADDLWEMRAAHVLPKPHANAYRSDSSRMRPGAGS